MKNASIFRITTVPLSLNYLLKGQLSFLNNYFDVTAISSDGDSDWSEVSKRENVACKIIHMERDISFLVDFISLIKLWWFFCKKRPFIIHANTPKASLISMVAAYFAFVPYRIYTVTGLRFEGTQGRLRKVLILMEKITCFFATHVNPEGKGVKKQLIDNNITKRELQIIANGSINGIDVNYFDANYFDAKSLRLENSIASDDFVFCFVGRLVRDKGINELVRVFCNIYEKNTKVKLLLVGPFENDLDPVDSDVYDILQNHTGIILTGFQKDVRPFLAIADLFVFPSYREGFPNVVMQAGAMGLPSIVSNINGCNEIIVNGVNGVIIPPKDTESLYNSMYELCTNSEKCSSMSKVARKMIVDRYEQTFVWSELLKEYQRIIS